MVLAAGCGGGNTSSSTVDDGGGGMIPSPTGSGGAASGGAISSGSGGTPSGGSGGAPAIGDAGADAPPISDGGNEDVNLTACEKVVATVDRHCAAAADCVAVQHRQTSWARRDCSAFDRRR